MTEIGELPVSLFLYLAADSTFLKSAVLISAGPGVRQAHKALALTVGQAALEWRRSVGNHSARWNASISA